MKRKDYRKKSVMAVVALVVMASCGGKRVTDDTETLTRSVQPDEATEVTVAVVRRAPFYHDLVSNGRVSAVGYADLKFPSSETVVAVMVKNGDRVHKGQVLARQDTFRLANSYVRAQVALEQAELELRDVLIGQGYNPEALQAVPAEALKWARTRSGYSQSKAACELARHELAEATLLAPFDGTVANLFAKPFNAPPAGEPFCRVLRSGGMEVDFMVMENEVPWVHRCDRLTVSPFVTDGTAFEGTVQEVNPVVDASGMVRVKGFLPRAEGLLDGCNVKVAVRQTVNHALSVPKSAVVMRSGRQVVFTLEHGQAIWNYVETGLENSDSYLVTSGLEPGDTVIVTSNMNLAHEAVVTLKE